MLFASNALCGKDFKRIFFHVLFVLVENVHCYPNSVFLVAGP